MPQKLTDVRDVEVIVLTGNTEAEATFAHGLEDNAGTDLTPDAIIVEPIDSDDYDDPAFWQYGSTRPDAATTRIWVRTDAAGADWTLNFRVTSVYLHSIQSDDHAV